MKWIVFTLVFVNVVFFLWHYRTPSDEASGGGPREDSLKLVLLEEYQNEQTEAKEPAPPESVAQKRCYTLGPFDSKKDAAQARQRLAQWGVEATQRVSKDKSRAGFWVMIPPSDTREQARAHIVRLKENNISDYFLVATGEFKNAVSLGVFSRPELARRRLSAMEKLGFKARLEEVELPQREYWLDWPQGPEARLSLEQLGALREQDEDIGQTQRECRLED